MGRLPARRVFEEHTARREAEAASSPRASNRSADTPLRRQRYSSTRSARRWASILAESEDMGAVFRSEVDKAVADFLDYIKLQKEKGEISIIKDGDKVVE